MRRSCVVLLGLASAGAGCGQPPMVVVQDLAAELPAAEVSGAPTTIVFGTPASQVYEERGLFRPDAGDGEGFSWANRRAQLKFTWTDVRARWALLDVAPAPGLQRQTVDLTLNGGHVARLPFRSRERLFFELPVRFQKTGDNRLSLSFGRVVSLPDGTTQCARVHGLSLDAGGGASLREMTALPPIDVVREGGVPSVVQACGLALRYPVRLPAAAELRASPSVAASSRAAARLSVAFESDPGHEQELWSRTFQPGERGDEIRVELGPLSARTARLALRVEAPGPAWASWAAPRILAPPAPPAKAVASQALRAALQGSNVVLIVLDAAGATHFSGYGYGRRTTPNIDAIAAEGVLFERAYTTGVYTLAAMGSLWASRPPDECSPAGLGLSREPGSPLTLTQRLSARGIHSAGLVTNPRAGRAYGMDRGFSEFREVLTEGVRGAQALRETAEEWLRRAPASPFFLYIHFREPHFPYNPPPPFDSQFGQTPSLPPSARREQAVIDAANSGRASFTPDQLDDLVKLYDGNLAYADHEVGELRRTLETLGLWDRSVIVITGDHGEALHEHGFIGHNRQVHEESAHVPLVVHFPRGRGPSGVRVAALTDHLDMAPTIAEIFGVAGGDPKEQGFAGRSLLGLALGGPGRDFVVTRSATGKRPLYAIRDARYTLIRSQRYGGESLFDAVADPRETRDLAASLPLETAYARGRLFVWLAGLREPATATESEPELSPEQRAQLKALGYIQ